MRLRRGRDEWNQLLKDLETLQRTWQGKMANLAELGRGARAHGVVFGIETGRRSISERKASSLTQLNALLDEWESIGKLKASGPAAEAIEGIDFGIRLVIRHVRRYLNRLARPKPPTSADGGHAPPRYGRSPHSQA